MRTICSVLAICAISAAGCMGPQNMAQRSPSAFPAPFGAQPTPNASSKTVDAYLMWLDQFVDARTEAIFRVEQEAKVRSRNVVLSAQGRPSPSASDLAPQIIGAMNELSASQKPLIAIYTQNANDFRQKAPPPECAQLANLYGAFLAKQATSAAAMQASMDRALQAANTPEGAQPPHDNGAEMSIPEDGSDDMLKANEELRRIYKTYPALKTPGFMLK